MPTFGQTTSIADAIKTIAVLSIIIGGMVLPSALKEAGFDSNTLRSTARKDSTCTRIKETKFRRDGHPYTKYTTVCE